MKWPDDFINKVICGDCLEVMKDIPDNSIDTIITDPPYGIGFMGKEWDNFKYDRSINGLLGFQNWMTEIAKEMLRINRPGGTMLIFGGTRTWHRLTCAVEDAGWIIKDTIMWLYGSGFPKATDISKQIDKIKGVEREIVGKHPNPAGSKGNTFTLNQECYLTKPATPEAQLWDGWKSHGLKPSWEPILLCMKPNEGSYAENALEWGVAGLNIDGGRIGNETIPAQKRGNAVNTNFMSGGFTPEHTGRFPANLVISCHCDYQLKSGITKEQKKKLMDWLYENT